ncbi:hypothetical protein HNV12_14930 [Methanococcoides sp. SA1]|nr:hypothetical protein [Methanococcoides sp. SA1]
MTIRKIIYFNLITVVLLLLYMALHLFLHLLFLGYAQFDGKIYSYINFGFFGPHTIDIYGNENGGIISPSVVMTTLLIFNMVLLIKNRFAKQVMTNTIFLAAALLLYHLFLNDVNSAMELAIKPENTWFREFNLLGYELYDHVMEITIRGYNYSVFPIILAVIYNISKLVSRDEADDN